MLVYDEKIPRHFWKFDIVTGVIPSSDSEIRGAIARIKKTNAIQGKGTKVKVRCSNNW